MISETLHSHLLLVGGEVFHHLGKGKAFLEPAQTKRVFGPF
jgi:hypothetical protein